MSKRAWIQVPLDDLDRVAPPGLDGTYRDTCILCLHPTDTAFATVGDDEWHAGFLVSLGLSVGEAIRMVEMAPPDTREWYHRVCADCAASLGMPAPGVLMEGTPVPAWHQPA